MLRRANRHEFETLLDAITLAVPDSARRAIVYLETARPPVELSRTDFRGAVWQYAAALQRMEIEPGDLVIIAHTQNLESVFAFWGAMLLGAIPSMFPTLTEKLDADMYLRKLSELARRSHVRAVLTTDEFATLLRPRLAAPVYGSDQLKAGVERAEIEGFQPHRPDPDEIAFLQHSSGTTGLQKGVALSHRAVLNQLASYSDALCLREDDLIVSWLPLYHDMGLIAGFLMPLVQGVPLVLMSPFDWVSHPALMFRAIHEYRGTLCWLPNFAYNHCARRIRQRDLEGMSVTSMRRFINCSEPVYYESHRLFQERFAELGVTPHMLGVSYAMAENTFAVTQTLPDHHPRLDTIDRVELESNRLARPVAVDHPNAVIKVSCGPPIDGTEVRAVDSGSVPLPERTVGEIAIRSNCMLQGYYRRPDLNPFRDGWYLTGDMGYIADGEVYIVGRYKDLIINAGKNVYPQDIEAIINTVPGVHPGRVVVFGVSDEHEGTELVAAVAEVNIVDPEARKRIGQTIRQAVVQQSEVTLSHVHLVGEKWLIKTSSGKIARAANRDKWLVERETNSVPGAAR